MHLISLASRQIWPQVHAVLHFNPSRLTLLHSPDAAESQRPAQRLSALFTDAGLLPPGAISLQQAPDNDLDGVRHAVARAVRESPEPAEIHFTGGNKLMATGAFLAARDTRVPASYLERRNQLLRFLPTDAGSETRTEPIDPARANSLDAVALLRCQLDGVQVAGQPTKLALTPNARSLSDHDFDQGLFSHASERIEPRRVSQGKGDDLELAVSAAVMRAGPHSVYQGVRIQTEGSASDQTDLDVLFNWRGFLWIVDCKDKTRHQAKLKAIRKALGSNAGLCRMELGQLEHDLEGTHYMLLKQALFDARQGGGLQGRLIVVRRSELPQPVLDFANTLGVTMLTKQNLAQGMRRILA